MSKPFYITTTLPYVNADPHIGHAFELVSADIIARYRKLMGDEVFFNTGTDEHGLKIFRKAAEARKSPQEFADILAEKFQSLPKALGISSDVHFIRTSNPRHKSAAQELWRRCDKNGFIYKQLYRGKYCVGCELEKSDSELEGGRCPIHPNLEIETIEEENYFFAFSKFQTSLLDFYRKRPDFVFPAPRFNEIQAFAERGLKDFSISRLKSKLPWGVEVPGDPEHSMYVWFDALVSYISTLGWPDDAASFKKWWVDTGGALQFAGKDQIRQQAAMWQAMLMASGLPPSKQIVIHGFITHKGEKMSKSLGNIVDPFELVKEYGADAVRFYLSRHVHPFEDSDFTLAKFKEAYNADLANGLGNLVSRIMKMAQEYKVRLPSSVEEGRRRGGGVFPQRFFQALDSYNIKTAADYVWRSIRELDELIQKTEPYKLVKIDREKAQRVISELLEKLFRIAELLVPLLPETAEKIKKAVMENKMPGKPLFLRK